jgi:hypothetical protein
MKLSCTKKLEQNSSDIVNENFSFIDLRFFVFKRQLFIKNVMMMKVKNQMMKILVIVI